MYLHRLERINGRRGSIKKKKTETRENWFSTEDNTRKKNAFLCYIEERAKNTYTKKKPTAQTKNKKQKNSKQRLNQE